MNYKDKEYFMILGACSIATICTVLLVGLTGTSAWSITIGCFTPIVLYMLHDLLIDIRAYLIKKYNQKK